jgi:hypothetical protein
MACQGDTGVYFICISSSSSIPVVYGAAHRASDSASKHFDAKTCSRSTRTYPATSWVQPRKLDSAARTAEEPMDMDAAESRIVGRL